MPGEPKIVHCHQGLRRRCLLALFSALALRPAPAWSQTPEIDAPNVVPISARLVSSGQPTPAALARLKSQGFGAVVYLAPPTVADAVRDEAAIIERQGMVYLNLPIRFDQPTEADFDAFASALKRLSEHKVLVHCQVNMRASSMVFLHRVIVGREAPELAYADVVKVWSPNGPWKVLMLGLLRKHGIAFEPY